MLCDICHKKKARIYYTEITNGEKKEQHLCEDCASVHTSLKLKNPVTNQEITLGNFLSGILDTYYAAEADKKKQEDIICPRCGMSASELVERGRFGCSECYQMFSDILDKNLRTIQGADSHIGKHPKNRPTPKKRDTERQKSISEEAEEIVQKKLAATETRQGAPEIERLSMLLKKAVGSEEYEEAARLRDEIRALKASAPASGRGEA